MVATAMNGPGGKRIKVLTGFVCLLFACLFALVPWSNLSGVGGLEDREVYISKIESGISSAEEKDVSGVLESVSNEILWDVGIQYLANYLSIDVDAIFYVISVLTLIVFSMWLVPRHGLSSILLLVSPIVVDFAISQLRSALATSVFIVAVWAWQRNALIVAAALMVAASLIHSIVPLIFTCGITVFVITKGITGRYRRFQPIASLLVGLVSVVILGPLRVGILNFVGDRRAEYATGYISFQYMSFWILIALILLLVNKDFQNNFVAATERNFAIFIITVFAGLAVLGLPSIRFLSIAYPVIFSAVLSVPRVPKVFLLMSFTFYTVVLWSYWLGFL